MRHEILTAFDRNATPAEAAGRWEGDRQTLTPVREGANIVYQFTMESRPAFLRLTHSSHRSRAQVGAEMDFIKFLKSRGNPVAAPIASRSGELIEQMESSAGTFFASVFEEAPGQRVQWGPDADNRRTLQLLGSALGRLHAIARTFPPSARFHWHQDRLLFTLPEALPDFEAPIKSEAAAVFTYLESVPVTPESFGLIHGDFIPSNIRRQGDVFTPFDFDDCCYHWYLYDIAIFMWSASHLPLERRRAYLGSFLEGYAKNSPLPADAAQQINWFRRLSNVSRYFHSLRNWDLINITPEQLKELEHRRDAVLNPIDFT
jgi:Ser/Thr protein kinase RdoA (MazF antagonist)